MIKNNKFFFKKIEKILFIGESPYLHHLFKINDKLNISTKLISSQDQSRLLPKGIDFKVFNKLNNSFKKFIKKEFSVDKTLFISLGARYIFSNEILIKVFNNNLINFHDSRLPYDAGGGDFSWRILREDRIDCQLVHLVDDGIDTGPILDTECSIVPKDCKVPKDFEKYKSIRFVEFYSKFIDKLFSGKKFELKFQSKNIGRYNPRLNTNINGFINWDMDSYEIYNFINAFDDPFSGASTFLNNGKFGKLKIKSVHIHGGDSSNHPFMSGLVTRHDEKWLVVSTRNKHSLLIENVIDSKGRNVLDQIKVGDRFFTPSKYLDISKSRRVIYNAKGLKISNK